MAEFRRERYLDIEELSVKVYTDERIDAYIEDVKQNLISEHGFCRLTANIGFLLAHGRCGRLKNKFIGMMNICCEQIPVAMAKNGRRTGNDFSVKEIILCILELEKYKIFSSDITDSWRNKLSDIIPSETYSRVSPTPPEKVGNWASFSACSEQLRIYSGIGGDSDFVDNQIASQLLSFDENGMYLDPGNPMFYDIVPRLQLAACLFFGYNGKYKKELEDILVKSSELTLKMQSATGEIPFGGRSNQFLHNETLFAALCEYYAFYWSRHGDMNKASSFRDAACMALDGLDYWLSRGNISHIKNGFAPDDGIGCESYAYYDKYMVTLGSWCMLAYLMADDKIEPSSAPARNSSYTYITSESFHKTFLTSNGYSAELETNADGHYDCNGIGKLQKNGAPPFLCISCPCPVNPKYRLPRDNSFPLSIAPGIKKADGSFAFALDEGAIYRYLSDFSDKNEAKARYSVEFNTGEKLFFDISLDKEGLTASVSSHGEAALLIPAFEYDGSGRSVITVEKSSLEISFENHFCRYETDGIIEKCGYSSYNRNGLYSAYMAKGKNKVTVKVTLS